MRTSVVLTVIGDDKPGIVEQLAERVLATGANWEESRMARLAGKFAGLLRVSVESGQADALAAALRSLDAGGLRVIVEQSSTGDLPVPHVIRLELLGNDRPGIVRDISRVLAQHRVNIEDLQTDVRSAPMSGDALFHASASLRVPAEMSADRLRQVLEALAGELMVDLTLAEESAQPG
jgi:glycine cleavage system regulatory protein